jgi:p-cymene monooxygenase electron transfer component
MLKLFKSLFGPAKPRQTVEILPYGITLEIGAGQTLLEAALANGVPYPHNCTVGTCGACKTGLKQGQVKALTDFGYTLSKAELDAGYILACQAVPLAAHSVIEVADPSANQLPLKTVGGRIGAVEPLTHDIMKVTVELEQPLDYLAGQYAAVRAPMVDGARQYSFADAPMRGGRSKVSFFIRKVPGGAFTEALFGGRLLGQAVTLEAPHGAFYLRAGTAPMVCVAGGSGLAPLISLLEDARRQRIRRPCVLLFGARTEADLYLLEQIGELARAWPEPFRFIPVLADEAAESDWRGARGRVTDHLDDAFGGVAWALAEAYLCGPAGMIDAGIDRLVALGVPLESIFYDKFTTAAPVGMAA